MYKACPQVLQYYIKHKIERYEAEKIAKILQKKKKNIIYVKW